MDRTLKGGSKKAKKSNIDPYAFYQIPKVTIEDLKKIIDSSSKPVRDTMNKIFSLMEEFKKHNKYVEIVPLPLSERGIYWADFSNTFMNMKHGQGKWEDDHIIITVYLDKQGKNIQADRSVAIDYTTLGVKEKNKMLDALEKHVPKNFIWDGTNIFRVLIVFQEFDGPLIISRKELVVDDFIPRVHVEVEFDKSSNLIQDRDIVYVIKQVIVDILKLRDNRYVLEEYGQTDVNYTIYKLDPKTFKENKDELEKYLNHLKEQKQITHFYYELFEEHKL